MLNNTNTVKGSELKGRDQSFGRVKDFYFDDESWTIRYLVADTGNWIPDRRVLISPFAIGRIDTNEKQVQINLTKSQIENCPAVDSRLPVSRQYEKQYHSYYGWPMYWYGPHLWGPIGSATYSGASPWTQPSDQPGVAEEGDPHLRSVAEVCDYRIQARDEEIGHVEDFIFDENWAVRYLVIDTVNWWQGKKVLLAPGWINDISWRESKVFIDLDRATIKQAPEYQASRPITRDYESRLHAYYHREGYWTGKSQREMAHSH